MSVLMLDQNTDRMWMVIGAIVVGAAIIGVVSLAFPQMMNNIIGKFTTMLNGSFKAPKIGEGVGSAAINVIGSLFG